MQHYYKIFHYSSISNLKNIDPNFYGTSYLNTKAREGGLNKSYFYTEDKPENCIKSINRYELYLPANWKDLIYDLGKDANNLYGRVTKEIEAQYHRPPYQDEVKKFFENFLFQNGYKGFINTLSTLPHVLVLFHPLVTEKPKSQEYYCYDWNGKLIEKNTIALSTTSNCSIMPNSIFNFPIKDTIEKPLIDISL
jgi:hypothetical protein